jgi:hypothetical protein
MWQDFVTLFTNMYVLCSALVVLHLLQITEHDGFFYIHELLFAEAGQGSGRSITK